MIYLDHNASSPLRPSVLEAMQPWLSSEWGNPSSTHRSGQRARTALEESRERLARLIHAKAPEILFTSGGSASISLALKGLAQARERISSSRAEHHAGIECARWLESKGAKLQWLDVDGEGQVRLEPDKGGLLSLMLANNETGALHPVAQYAGLAHRYGALYHCDAVQGFGKVPIDVQKDGIDLLSAGAHKFGGPKGVGFLYVREGISLDSLVSGGAQEKGLFSGTENVAGIVGMAKAAELAHEGMAQESTRLAAIRDDLQAQLLKGIPGLKVNAGGGPRLSNTLSVIMPGVESDLMIMRLDQEGIEVSAGSACAAGAVEPSHVMLAMGLPLKEAKCVLRISLGWSNAKEEAGQAGEAILKSWKTLKDAAI